MLTMDQIHHIRAMFYEQGYNISEIAKATGRDWKTVAKYIDMIDLMSRCLYLNQRNNSVRNLNRIRL